MLSVGVTTMRDVGSTIAATAGLRDAVEAGAYSGPRVVFAGFQFHPGLPGRASNRSSASLQEPADSFANARALALARAFRAQYARMDRPSSLDAGARFVEDAHGTGMRLSGRQVASLALVAAGIDGQEQLSEIPYEDVLQLFRAAGTWVVPARGAFSSRLRLMDVPSLLDRPGTAPLLNPYLGARAGRYSPTLPPFMKRLAQEARLGTGKAHRVSRGVK